MLLRNWIGPSIVALFVGIGVAGTYVSRVRWMPYLFPEKSATKTDDHGHEHDEDGGHEGHDHSHDHSDRVKLSKQAQENLNLEVENLFPEPYFRKMLIPGVVVDRPGETDRGVTARVAGIVSEIKAKPGDAVSAGDPLFTVHLVSEFVQSTQTELVKASRELKIAEMKRDRTAELVKLGTKSKMDLAEDEAFVKRFSTQVEAYRRQLQNFGLTSAQVTKAEGGEIVTEITVTAPLHLQDSKNGKETASETKRESIIYEVQELKIHLGDYVQAGQTLCLLANHQFLFIEGKAFKSEARMLAEASRENRPVEVEVAEETPGDWEPLGSLTLGHIGSVDPAARTLSFFVPLKNQSDDFVKNGKKFFVWRFHPGQRVRLKIPLERVRFDRKNVDEEVFILPPGALVREGPEAYVFSQNGDFFERKAVRVLHEERDEIIIANDGSINPALFIVRNNAAAINRALKAQAGGGGGGHEGHDHAH